MVSKVTKGIIISFWLLFAIAVGAVVLLFSAIAKGSIGYMPPVEQLENPIDKYASQVVSADGKTLGIYAHSQDNRIMVNYNDLSPDLVKALIATEDVRFTAMFGKTDIFRCDQRKMSVLPNIAVSMRRDCFVQLLREAF